MARTLAIYQSNVGDRTGHKSSPFLAHITKRVNDAKDLILGIDNGRFSWLRNQLTLSFAQGDYRQEISSSENFKSLAVPHAVYDETVLEDYITVVDSWDTFLKDAEWKPQTSAPTSDDYGTPSFCVIEEVVEGGVFKRYLRLDVPTDTAIVLRVHFYRNLVDLSDSSDTFLGMPANFESAIEEYAVWKMLEYRGHNLTAQQIAQNNWETFYNALLVGADSQHIGSAQLKIDTSRL